jgi:hypothetical protein
VFEPPSGVKILDTIRGDIFNVELSSLARVKLKGLSSAKRLPYICNTDPSMVF